MDNSLRWTFPNTVKNINFLFPPHTHINKHTRDMTHVYKPNLWKMPVLIIPWEKTIHSIIHWNKHTLSPIESRRFIFATSFHTECMSKILLVSASLKWFFSGPSWHRSLIHWAPKPGMTTLSLYDLVFPSRNCWCGFSAGAWHVTDVVPLAQLCNWPHWAHCGAALWGSP